MSNNDVEVPLVQIEPIFESDLEWSMSWTLTFFTESQIDFELNFADPLLISQGYVSDKLVIMLNLDEYTTNKGTILPANTVLTTYIPR